jgi:hypothetical protein
MQSAITVQHSAMVKSGSQPALRQGKGWTEPFRRLLKDLSESYRPELHYMRGPGPKWRAKHGISA